MYLLFIVGGVILLGMPLPLPYDVAFFVVFAVVVAAVGVCAMVTTVVNPADDFKNTHVSGSLPLSCLVGKGALLLRVQAASEHEYGTLPSVQQVRFWI